MSSFPRFDHVGITVADLDATLAFFTSLGLAVEGRQVVEGAFVETVTGLAGVRVEIAMLVAPDATTKIELSTFHTPDAVPGPPAPMANQLGYRNVCFEVADLHATVAQVRAAGYDLVGDVGNYEDTYLMAYVRGPEGLTVALAEFIGAA